MTTSDNIAAIEKALEGVTHAPGPWENERTSVYCDDKTGQRVASTEGDFLFWTSDQKRANAAYIAACNPVAISTLIAEARKAEAMKQEIAEKDAEIAKLRRLATDRAYMMKAYRDMLGTNGLEVAEMWERKGVLRQHTDWGPASATMTGEERAQVLLGVEEEVSQPIDFLDSNVEASDFRARTLLNGGSDAQG